uniref:Uncharacterized protein n=1 Tax=Arundo donax TaxID=35708 RepID=A0A0A9D9D8_ARUDO
MATAATASAPASASTSGRDALAASSSSPAAVCLVPFRWWARVREEEAAGGVQYAATAAASPSYYGLRLLHSFLHPDLVLRASTAGSAAPLPAAATRLSRPTSSRGRSPEL